MLIPSMLNKEHREEWEQNNRKHRKAFLDKVYAEIMSSDSIEYNSRVIKCQHDECRK